MSTRKYWIGAADPKEVADSKRVCHVKAGCYRDTLDQFALLALKYPLILAKMKNNYRNTMNVEFIDWLQYDFDDGITAQEIHDKLAKYTHIILGSKNHQKEKHRDGTTIPACDRFHAFILFSDPVSDPQFYKYMVDRIELECEFTGKADPAAKDITRYFDRHSIELFRNDAEMIDVVEWQDFYQCFLNIQQTRDNQQEEEYQEFKASSPEQQKAALQDFLNNANPAISGQLGHNTTFYVACRIHRLGGCYADLQHYNATKCFPKWQERSLKHKWEDARRKSNG